MAPKQVPFTASVAGAVKAELARRGFEGSALVDVLGLSRNTVYSRLRGDTALTTDELAAIAAFLGIELDVIWASAELGKAVA
jgi:transcriptional regulator with XRE-family HTH domain